MLVANNFPTKNPTIFPVITSVIPTTNASSKSLIIYYKIDYFYYVIGGMLFENVYNTSKKTG